MYLKNYSEVFELLYGPDSGKQEQQRQRYRRLDDSFTGHFGDCERYFFSTPGRTEIGGNHTDHNNGKVLAAAINPDTIAIAAPAAGLTVTLHSEGYDEPFVVNLEQKEVRAAEAGRTEALIRGVAFRLESLGYKIRGFNAVMTSDVRIGSGLSSSASVEVLIGTVFSHLFNKGRIPAETLAAAGQFAENSYFGKPCGLMDQMACALGGITAMDFADPAMPLTRKISFGPDAAGYKILVVDTGSSHSDLTADYSAVPREMKTVAGYFNEPVCRNLRREQVLTHLSDLRKRCGDRAVLRCLHYFDENERVDREVAALESGAFDEFLRLIRASGNSSFKYLQNIYSPGNVEEQGMSLALMLTERFIAASGQGACRVHGGGFAGTIQVFLPEQAVDAYRDYMRSVFETGGVDVLDVRSAGTFCLNAAEGRENK